MIKLVVLGGTGDVYLVCALVDAFRKHHGRTDVAVVTRPKFSAVCDLFPGVPALMDEALVYRGENDLDLQRSYDNRLDAPDGVFYTHPCFERSRVRVDHLTTKPDVSQADMYRMLLRVPPEAPLSKPRVPQPPVKPNTVFLIPDAVSWPNTQEQFWLMLTERLVRAGREVIVNDKRWPMGELFHRLAAAEWVIGPQCGVMSILCTGGFPCRKTLATPSVDDERAPGFLAPQTYPYAYVTKFANEDYDVEEFKITIQNRLEMVEAIATGANAQRLRPHMTGPVTTVQVLIAPGDALDRLAVLAVKRHRFGPVRRASIEREYQRMLEATRTLRLNSRLDGLYHRLIEHHEAAFDILERAVPAVMLDDEMSVEDHVAMIKLNRKRVDLRREIDAATASPFTEVKSYYNREDTP